MASVWDKVRAALFGALVWMAIVAALALFGLNAPAALVLGGVALFVFIGYGSIAYKRRERSQTSTKG
jgi:hypothetical protein